MADILWVASGLLAFGLSMLFLRIAWEMGEYDDRLWYALGANITAGFFFLLAFRAWVEVGG